MCLSSFSGHKKTTQMREGRYLFYMVGGNRIELLTSRL